jgi:GTPase SAR1 family protein
MNFSSREAALAALGRIEGYKTDIEWAMETLEAAPLWRPAAALRKQAGEALHMISDLAERFERKLVITIVGPCGAGKSTLLNALSGVDDLSESGLDRPTTRRPVVLCRDRSDALQLIERLGDDNVRIRHSRDAAALDHILLIDTPDIDSTEQARHAPIVREAIALSDVLICLFDSENPKRRDYIDFLAPYVQVFSGESLLCVLNKCDRQDEDELRETILPELAGHLRGAWDKPVRDILCLAARRHLDDPKWDPKAPPKHDFDQFEALRDEIFGAFNSAGHIVDRRLENARSLKDYVSAEIRLQVERDGEALVSAMKRIREAEAVAADSAVDTLRSDDPRRMLGVNVLLYQKLAQRWLGPVGWIIAIWARVLTFGAGVAAMFRFGRPITQVLGVGRSGRPSGESGSAANEAEKGERVDTALRDYRKTLLREWPDISEALIRSRFEKSVRRIEEALPDREALGDELATLWNEALEDAMERAARKLSGLGLQFLFNLPVLALIAYVGWMTTDAFLREAYFTGDFFLHAFLTMGLILFLCFFLYQIIVRLAAGTERLTGQAFEAVKAQVAEERTMPMNPIGEQVAAVLGLSALPAEGGKVDDH